jgi:hypothetical protein
MSARGTADIVFCLDASHSMQPCFDAMRRYIGDFVSSLQSNTQMKWDWRLDYVAHRAGAVEDGAVFAQRSLYYEDVLTPLYNGSRQSTRFFTSDLEEFKRGLTAIKVEGDEAPLVALDSCLDFPWRPAASCHRVVILLTDEPAEDGVFVDTQRAMVPKLIQKIQSLKVLLFMVGPESETFNQLSQVNKSEYEVVDGTGDGLCRVDFRNLLSAIGKSVSVSTLQSVRDETVDRGLFGQASWGTSDEEIRGA